MITINCSEKVWAYLNQNRRPHETFNEILERVLNLNKINPEAKKV